MARPERTDVRARYSLLSGDFPALAKVGSWYEMVESFGRGLTESLRTLGADADKDINLSVNVRWGLDGRVLSLTLKRLRRLLWLS